MHFGRFGALALEGDRIMSFKENQKVIQPLINAGFFVLSPEVIDYIDADHTIWEQEPLMNLAEDGEFWI